jgi:PAS domain S-box-containing protein
MASRANRKGVRPAAAKPSATAGSFARDGNEDRYRDFAEAASDWFWELDQDLRFTYMSKSIHAPAAEFAAEFLGKPITEVRAGGLGRTDWSPLLEAQLARRPFRDFRFRRTTPGGGVRHLSISGVPIFDADGAFRGYRGIGRDITEEVIATSRAIEAQTRLVDAIESIPDSVVMLDAEDRFVLCNSQYRELYRPIAHLFVPGTRFVDICRAAAESGMVPGAVGRVEPWLEERMARHRKSGSWTEERRHKGRWYQLTERPTAEGGIIIVQVDVTDLKLREQELAEKSQLLQATLDNMEQGLLMMDAGFRVKAWNDRFLALHDIPAGAIAAGLSLEGLLRLFARLGEYGARDVEDVLAERVAQIRDLTPKVMEWRRPNGVVIEQRRIRMPDGGILVTYTDITERKRVEADLRRAKDEAELASRSKTEFLANMSHELRTPLNAIIGFSDVLAGEIFGSLGDGRYQDYARDIRDSGFHLLNLINDVLDVSKIEFGKVELQEEEIEIPPVVESCVRLMRERAHVAEVRLETDLAPDLPALRADRRRLKQILINLLSNSVKFTPAGGRVTVAASEENGWLRLAVSDTGIGIAPQDLETALRPFGQIDSRLSRKYQGTGLGLPLTKAMAELHGGRLELESAPGQGTTAIVLLPPERVIRRARAAAPAPTA